MLSSVLSKDGVWSFIALTYHPETAHVTCRNDVDDKTRASFKNQTLSACVAPCDLVFEFSSCAGAFSFFSSSLRSSVCSLVRQLNGLTFASLHFVIMPQVFWSTMAQAVPSCYTRTFCPFRNVHRSSTASAARHCWRGEYRQCQVFIIS